VARASERPDKGASSERPKVSLTAGGDAAGDAAGESACEGVAGAF